MDKRYKLNVQEILDKEFHTDIKGYNAYQVDSFLDDVIYDYQLYDETIQHLGESLRKFEEENKALKQQVKELENALEGKEALANKPIDNIDILKRLSALEKTVANLEKRLNETN